LSIASDDGIYNMNLPKMWSGSAFVGKFWLPLILFGGAALVIASPITDFGMLMYRLMIVVPVVLAGLFFLLVPVQVRGEGPRVAYRRWFHWTDLSVREIKSLHMLSLGKVTTFGPKRELFFFIEPANRHLLGQGSQSDRAAMPITAVGAVPSSAFGSTSQSLGDLLAGSLGLLVELLAPTVPLGHPGPRWMAPLWSFENQYYIAMAVFGVIMIFIYIRTKSLAGARRALYVFFIGMLGGSVLIRL
jgi:hypothetical protein